MDENNSRVSIFFHHIYLQHLLKGNHMQTTCWTTPLEFTNVLYVPSLFTNLFSVLYLTIHHHFTVSIELDTIHFIRDGQTVFQEKTSSLNAAFLVGNTIPVEELASLSSTATLPMDLTLLHRRLCHHHLAGIRKLLLGNLVTGLKLDSKAEPDPVCEACKAGKMHADPFPTSSTRASRPLQHVHSDVHGPVKVMTYLASKLFTF